MSLKSAPWAEAAVYRVARASLAGHFCCIVTGTALGKLCTRETANATGLVVGSGGLLYINMTVSLCSTSIITMDSLSIADNTTVVAGPSSAANRRDLSHHQDDFSKFQSSQPDKRAANNFVRTVDYTLEGRQFFVPVGNDGLIGALQTLDRELQNVSWGFHLEYFISIKIVVGSLEGAKSSPRNLQQTG